MGACKAKYMLRSGQLNLLVLTEAVQRTSGGRRTLRENLEGMVLGYCILSYLSSRPGILKHVKLQQDPMVQHRACGKTRVVQPHRRWVKAYLTQQSLVMIYEDCECKYEVCPLTIAQLLWSWRQPMKCGLKQHKFVLPAISVVVGVQS